jgi:hypothetical protein
LRATKIKNKITAEVFIAADDRIKVSNDFLSFKYRKCHPSIQGLLFQHDCRIHFVDPNTESIENEHSLWAHRSLECDSNISHGDVAISKTILLQKLLSAVGYQTTYKTTALKPQNNNSNTNEKSFFLVYLLVCENKSSTTPRESEIPRNFSAFANVFVCLLISLSTRVFTGTVIISFEAFACSTTFHIVAQKPCIWNLFKLNPLYLETFWKSSRGEIGIGFHFREKRLS